MIELDGAVGQISYRNGGWRMEVELRQAMPQCEIWGENNKMIRSDSYKVLGNVELFISAEDAAVMTKHDPNNPIKYLKMLVEIAGK